MRPTHCGEVSRSPQLASASPLVWPPHGAAAAWPSPAARRGEIVQANAGDHCLIYELLLAAGEFPSREEFHASLDNPFYEPSDRLLVKLAGRFVAHVQLSRREMRFGSARLPIAGLNWLVSLPEYREGELVSRLLAAAQQQMRDEGAVVALLRTTRPDRLQREGWFPFDRQRYTQAGAREILAWLSAHPLRCRQPLSTRRWRHVELPALMRIYQRNAEGAYGPLLRSEDYWRWLISRQGYDRILVAIEGDDRWEFGEQAPAIAGYAVMRQEHIVELYTEPGHATAAVYLLARACREAIEEDLHTLRFHPAGQPALGALHDLLLNAGGRTGEAVGAMREVGMVKVLDLPGLAAALHAELHGRAKAAGLPQSLELRIALDGECWRLSISRRIARLAPDRAGRCDLTTSSATFSQLLLGLVDPQRAVTAGLLTARTKSLLKLAGQLFPKRPLWRPPLDELGA